MTLIGLALAAVALWALIQLGRRRDGKGQGDWRIASAILSAVCLAGAVIAAGRGGWLVAAALTAAGLYLSLASRPRWPRRPRAEAGSSSLSEAEARTLLGVGPEAGRAEIEAAYRRLMARAHPDAGGSEGLAQSLNAARDRLLKT